MSVDSRDPLPVAVWLACVSLTLCIISLVLVVMATSESRETRAKTRCMAFCFDVGRPVEIVDPCTCEASHGD